jgi:hypothetical protein
MPVTAGFVILQEVYLVDKVILSLQVIRESVVKRRIMYTSQAFIQEKEN